MKTKRSLPEAREGRRAEDLVEEHVDELLRVLLVGLEAHGACRLLEARTQQPHMRGTHEKVSAFKETPLFCLIKMHVLY